MEHKNFLSVPSEVMDFLSPQSRTCIQNLAAHTPEQVDLTGQTRLAAVLVLLYEKSDQLRVLLTTRSKSLRAHPGETALPGGKVDESDVDELETAYREAQEEIGLPLGCPAVHTIGTLRPFLSNKKVVVKPVIALLSDLSVLDQLQANEAEVDRIFDHPLEALLDPTIMKTEQLVEKGTPDWPYDVELHSTEDRVLAFLGNSMYRMHRFRSTASPVKGLTAEILMSVAEIAYNRPTVFKRYMPGQPTTFDSVLRILEAAEDTTNWPSGPAGEIAAPQYVNGSR